MSEPVAFSVAWLFADVVGAAVSELNQLAETRGLNEAELRQLTAFEALHATVIPLLPPSRGLYMLVAPGSPLATASVKEALRGCAEAGGLPLVDLLHMRAAVAADWHNLPLDIDTVLWFGATRLADDLSLICASGHSSPERQAQLAAIRDLHGALGRVIRLERAGASEQDRSRANAKIESAFTRALRLIERALSDIRAEAAALKVRQ